MRNARARARRVRPCAASALLLACVAAGCSVGPRYTRPRVTPPTAWRAPADTTSSPADLAWWRVFRDTVLQDLIRAALAENTDLRIAVARVREARAQAAVAGGSRFPQLNLVGAHVDARIPGLSPAASPQARGAMSSMRSFVGVLDLSYEIDVWGRPRQTARAARADYRASAGDLQAVRITVVSDVAQAYIDLLALDRMAVVNRSTIASREASLDLVRRRFAGGLASELDVQQARQALDAARAVLPGIEQQIAQTENRLSILLGRRPGPIPRGAALDAQTVPPEIPAGLPSTLLERRPDIRAAEQRLIAANARTRAAVAGLFPKFSLTAVYGGQSTSLTDLTDAGSRLWVIAPIVSVPIFHGGTLRGDVAAARAREEQAVVAYEATVLQAFRDVDDALAFRHAARAARAARGAEVDAAGRALELARLRYVEGLGDYLAVLDAERARFGAELDLASSIADELRAVVQLYKALGGGWEAGPRPEAPR